MSTCSDGSGRGPLVDVDAVTPATDLRDQLKELGELNPSLAILEAQNEMKAKAREEKALKQIAKGVSTAVSVINNE